MIIPTGHLAKTLLILLASTKVEAILTAFDLVTQKSITLIPSDIHADTTAEEWALVDLSAATMDELSQIPTNLWIHVTSEQMVQIDNNPSLPASIKESIHERSPPVFLSVVTTFRKTKERAPRR